MAYVYILRSSKDRKKIYIGITNNLQRRLKEHLNATGKDYTHRYAPWDLEIYIVFNSRILAEKFELYLKSHSGRAFLKKRLIFDIKA